MYPIPSPNTLNILRNTKRTRNTHQNEETEPNIKNKNNSDSFYSRCQHELTFFNPHPGQALLWRYVEWGRGGGKQRGESPTP